MGRCGVQVELLNSHTCHQPSHTRCIGGRKEAAIGGGFAEEMNRDILLFLIFFSVAKWAFMSREF